MTTPNLPPLPEPGQLDPRRATDFGRQLLQYVRGFHNEKWSPAIDSVDRQNLAQALDHIEEAAAMLLNLSERVPTPAAPHGYAYVYPATWGETLRFNNGEQVNGDRPLRAKPYWFAQPAPGSDGAVQAEPAAEALRLASPQGWVLVPMSATPEMCVAGVKRMFEDKQYSGAWEDVYFNVWRAMLAAAPEATKE